MDISLVFLFVVPYRLWLRYHGRSRLLQQVSLQLGYDYICYFLHA